MQKNFHLQATPIKYAPENKLRSPNRHTAEIRGRQHNFPNIQLTIISV